MDGQLPQGWTVDPSSGPPDPVQPAQGNRYWQDYLPSPTDFSKGVAKGAVGDVVGAGQLAEDIPGVRGMVPEGVQKVGRMAKKFAMAPSKDFSESAGNVIGGSFPLAYAAPEEIAASGLSRVGVRLPALAREIMAGGIAGGDQPTESGSAASHLGGAAAGAAGVGALKYAGRAGQAVNRYANYLRKAKPRAGFGGWARHAVSHPVSGVTAAAIAGGLHKATGGLVHPAESFWPLYLGLAQTRLDELAARGIAAPMRAAGAVPKAIPEAYIGRAAGQAAAGAGNGSSPPPQAQPPTGWQEDSNGNQ